MNYNHLHYFWNVAHDGNLTRTAERLNLSQSALSVQIRKLEDQLGVVVFERSGRRVLVTPAGEQLVERQAELDELQRVNGQLSGEVERLRKERDCLIAFRQKVGDAGLLELHQHVGCGFPDRDSKVPFLR